MNDLTRRLNQIKNNRVEAWLTPSQGECLAALRRLLRLPQTVNLCGKIGVGKTFLAWQLADSLNFSYFATPRSFERASAIPVPRVIIDNCTHSRVFHREALRLVRYRNITHTVFISRESIQDYTTLVELLLTPQDLETVSKNLLTQGISGSLQAPNLWYLVNPYMSVGPDIA